MDTQTARKALGAHNDSELARMLGVSRQAVSYWQGQVPERWQYWVAVLARQKGWDDAKKTPAARAGATLSER